MKVGILNFQSLIRKLCLNLYIQRTFYKHQSRNKGLIRGINLGYTSEDLFKASVFGLFFMFLFAGLGAVGVSFINHSFKAEPNVLYNLSFGFVLLCQTLFCGLFIVFLYSEATKDTPLWSNVLRTLSYLLICLVPNKTKIFLSLRPWLPKPTRRIPVEPQVAPSDDSGNYWTNIDIQINTDVKQFLSGYQLDKKSFIKFFKERCLTRHGSLDFGFITLFLLIPNKESIPLESLKRILTNSHFPELFCSSQIKKLVEHKDYNYIWSNHTVQDLELIFSRRYDSEDIYYSLLDYMDIGPEDKTPIQKSNHYHDLIYNIKQTTDFYRVSKPVTKNNILEDKLDVGPYHLVKLKTLDDYRKVGDTLKNCLRNGPISDNTQVFAIYEDKKIKGAVSVDEFLNIQEIKAKWNKNFIGQYLVEGYFKNLKNKSAVSM